MKKYFVLFAGVLTATAVVAAPRLEESLAELNGAVAELLKPYQSDVSSSSLEFTSLAGDESQVLSTRLVGRYQRVGKVQTLDIKVAGLTYDFANGNPVVNLAGSVGFDFTQVFQQEQLNGLVDAAETMVEDIASNYTRSLGAAAVVKGTMIEKIKAENGDYLGFKASVAFRIDPSKLPEGKTLESIPVLNGVAFFHVTLNQGIEMSGTLMMNPVYQGYPLLKTALEKLLSRDPDAAKKITGIVEKLDKMAGALVDARAR